MYHYVQISVVGYSDGPFYNIVFFDNDKILIRQRIVDLSRYNWRGLTFRL